MGGGESKAGVILLAVHSLGGINLCQRIITTRWRTLTGRKKKWTHEEIKSGQESRSAKIHDLLLKVTIIAKRRRR